MSFGVFPMEEVIWVVEKYSFLDVRTGFDSVTADLMMISDGILQLYHKIFNYTGSNDFDDRIHSLLSSLKLHLAFFVTGFVSNTFF